MKTAEIAGLLPQVFRSSLDEGGVLAVLIEAMARQHAPSEAVLDQLDARFDPCRTDDRFVPLLARWVDLDRLFVQSAADGSAPAHGEVISTGIGRLRELVARAADLSQWRGTRRGLLAFLETATGAQGFHIDEQVAGDGGEPRPFHMCVHVPAGLAEHRVLIERIVEFEKPAYVTYDIDFTDNRGEP